MRMKELKENLKLKGAAIINRSGIIEEDALPDDLNRELFSVMCATVYGAVNTINTDVFKKNTKEIKFESDDEKVLISPYSNRHFLVIIAHKSQELTNFDFNTLLHNKN